MIVFLHIQKNAGSTLQHVLFRNYGQSWPRRALRRLTSRRSSPKGIPDAMKAVRPGEPIVAGHFSYGVHELLPESCKYLCLLRDPVDRLVSLYRYSASNPIAYYHRHARGKTCREFLLETELAELDNGQVRFLVGGSDDLFINRTPFGGCDKSLLEKAKANVRRDFYPLGLVERFDESLLLFQRVLGWRDCFYVRRNVTRRRTDGARIDEGLLDLVRERNALDVRLYDWAQREFESQVQDHVPDLESALSKFRVENEAFAKRRRPFIKVYDRTKEILGV